MKSPRRKFVRTLASTASGGLTGAGAEIVSQADNL